MRVIALLLVVGAVYANSWHDSLVYDDKLFADYLRFSDLTEIPRYFVDHVWAERTVESGLYRPMLFISVGLDAWLFGDWFAGYHLVNVFMHGIVTLLLYGFLQALLRSDARTRSCATFAAFLAAVVYGVHPVHNEVVNSVFNRSTMLAAIGMLAGLWLLIRFIGSKPVLAWCSLIFAYTFALFSRETAIVLPGIAVVVLFTYTPDSPADRLRRSIPVLLLLVPMVVYLALRGGALSGGELGPISAGGTSGIVDQIDGTRLLQPSVLLDAAGTLAEAMLVFLWPAELSLNYPNLSRGAQWAGLLVHLILLGAGWLLYRRGRVGLLAGLGIYYLAFLPASRLFGAGALAPHLQERYLYIPSIGLALTLGYGLVSLRERFDRRLAVAPVVLFVLLSVPVTGARNTQWSSEIALFEADYARGRRSEFILRLLTAAHLRQGDFGRVMEICDADNPLALRSMARVTVHCASAYSFSGRIADAERAYQVAARNPGVSSLARSNLAQHYLRQGRTNDAEVQFKMAVDAEQSEARKAYRTGYMLVHLYPNSREKLVEARGWFLEAARLEPQWSAPRPWLVRLDAALGTAVPIGEP